MGKVVQTRRDGRWVCVNARHLAETIPTPHRSWRTVKRKGKAILRFSQVGWVKVRLPGRTEDLTMVVARTPGRDMPFMLLTSLPVETVQDARRVLHYYARQWECEEGTRFLKAEVHLEQIRTFHWPAIRRLRGVTEAIPTVTYLGRALS